MLPPPPPTHTHTHTPAGGGVGGAGDGYSLQPLVVTDQGPVYCLKMKRQGMLHLSRKVEKPDEDRSFSYKEDSGLSLVNRKALLCLPEVMVRG